MIPSQWPGFDHVWKGLCLFDSSDAQARKPEPSASQNLPFSTVKLQVASVLWDCWLDIRKSIRPVKTWVTRCWRGYLSGAKCRWFAYGPADAAATPSSLASLKSSGWKSGMVEPFWCWLTGVVLEKSPLSYKLQVHLTATNRDLKASWPLWIWGQNYGLSLCLVTLASASIFLPFPQARNLASSRHCFGHSLEGLISFNVVDM